MEAEDIRQAMARVVEKCGPWTADSIHLGSQVHTLEPWLDTRLRRVVQIVHDLLGGSVDGRRILDLAFLEGQLGIELALHGAEVTGIEGREANLAKALFARHVLGLRHYEPILGDVRDLARKSFEPFDVVLCAGILYHLEAADAAGLLRDVAGVCRRVAIIDTHYSLEERDRFEWNGETYWGTLVEEHRADANAEEIEASLWYSLDNRHAFYFTRDSLANLLRHVGFTSVFECLVPYEYYTGDDPATAEAMIERPNRSVFVALKGDPVRIISSPITDATPERRRPERSAFRPSHAVFERAGRKLDRLLTRVTGQSGTFTQLTPRSWRNRPIWRGKTGGGKESEG